MSGSDSTAGNIVSIKESLTTNLKELYALSLRADEQLEQFQEKEKGQHSAVFQKDTGFRAESNRFLPYLIELSEDVQNLPDRQSDLDKKALRRLLTKIQKMHLVLNRFHKITAS